MANSTKDASTTIEKKKRVSKPIRKFPYYSIEESLKIAQSIKDCNAGNPWPVDQVASAFGVKKGGNNFYYLTAASRDYGFTVGTRDAKVVELTDLGRRFVYATSESEPYNAALLAFNSIELFKKVSDYYKSNEPKEEVYFKNTLKSNFGLDECFHDDFIRIYKENKSFLSKLSGKVTGHDSTVKTDGMLKKPIAKGNKIFVIMPFTEKTPQYPSGYFSEVLNQLIIPAAEEAGFVAETADRNGSDIIHSTIIKAINGAEMIIADLTEHNPNVLFELGIAIALKKPVVIIKSEKTGQIFDIDNTIRVLSYSQNLWKSTLESDIPALTSRIKTAHREIGQVKSYFETFLGNNQ